MTMTADGTPIYYREEAAEARQNAETLWDAVMRHQLLEVGSRQRHPIAWQSTRSGGSHSDREETGCASIVRDLVRASVSQPRSGR
jgi:hypothetical protein